MQRVRGGHVCSSVPLSRTAFDAERGKAWRRDSRCATKALFLFYFFYFSSFSFFFPKEHSPCFFMLHAYCITGCINFSFDAQGSTLRTPAAPRYTHLTPAPPSGQVPPAQLSRDYTKPLSLTN